MIFYFVANKFILVEVFFEKSEIVFLFLLKFKNIVRFALAWITCEGM